MKALILSFFAVILGYSLFFNEQPVEEQTKSIDMESFSVEHSYMRPTVDTLVVSPAPLAMLK